MKLLTVIFLAPFFLPFTAFAKPAFYEQETQPHTLSGKNIFRLYSEKFQEDGINYEAGKFEGYIMGVYDAGVNTLFCPPSTINVAELADVVGSYLVLKGSRSHFSGARLITETLSERYPCKRPD